jgi:hypothetical protein
MKKASLQKKDELRPEYKRSDFNALIRGKYSRDSSTVVTLDPDVAATFPDERAVNTALRSLMRRRKAARNTSRPARSPRRAR